MESIEQLKAMRDAARDRIEALPDYKLMTKLTKLIEELEEAFGSAERPAAGASDEAGEGEAADEEVDRGLAAAEVAAAKATETVEPVSAVGLGEFLAGDLTGDQSADIAEGAAQVEIEETVVTSPVEEVSDEAEEEAKAAPAENEGVLDAETALRQAMAEFEADLGKAAHDPNAARFRYGNSS